MKKHSKKKTFDRDIKYNRSAIFRSFLEHQLTGSSPESRSEVMLAFNRSIAKCLREPRTGRKPVTIKAIDDIDPKIIREAKHGHKVGYFICQIIEGAILITTFLFLTMSGTPEGEVLWKKLRIGRYDKEYLGLDNLRLFITSDLRSDMELVNLLKECKCDHLFDVEYKPDRIVAGVADDVMKYLSSNKYVMKLLNN